MSIRLMSMIFDAEFPDMAILDGKGIRRTVKPPTTKFVCLALADHANDEGRGAYPSINRLTKKTGLSRQGVINALKALKGAKIIFLMGRSELDTSDYTINRAAIEAFLEAEKSNVKEISKSASTPRVPPLVHPVYPPSTPRVPPLVHPVYPNHPLTTLKPPINQTPAGADAPARACDSPISSDPQQPRAGKSPIPFWTTHPMFKIFSGASPSFIA